MSKLQITSCTLFPATRPETTKTGNDIKNLWVIKFEYSDDEAEFSGEVLHRTNIPLRYHLDTAKGVVIYKLKHLNE